MSTPPCTRIFMTMVLIITFTVAAKAQVSPAPDSVKYYRQQLRSMYKTTFDSLQHSPDYVNASEYLKTHFNHTNAYTSFTVYANISSGSYDKLNKDIALTGFPALQKTQHGIGVGITTETEDRWIMDLSLFMVGINNSSNMPDSSIKTTYGSFLQYNFGYDFVKSRKINIYPYAGLGFRITSLESRVPDLVNTSYTSIIDIVQKEGRTFASKFNVAYQAGLGVDIVVLENKKGGGLMLFAKGGTDGMFGSGKFKIKGVQYDTQMRQGAWAVAVGVKIFSRD